MKNRRTSGMILLAAASLLCLAGCGRRGAQQESAGVLKARVSMVIGTAYILRASSPERIRVKLNAGIMSEDVVITTAGSSVNVVIPKRGVFKIKENSNILFSSLLMVDDENNSAKIKVMAGKMILGLEKLKKDSVFDVETPTAVAGVRGTSFMVSVQQKESRAFPYFVKIARKDDVVTKIAVLTGSVELSDPKGASPSTMIGSLKEATLINDDFKNVKIENITKISLDEIAVIRDFSEIRELKMKEITDEIRKAEPRIEEMMKAELKAKGGVKSSAEDLSKTEKALEQENLDVKKDAIRKMKTGDKKTDGKYLDDNKW